MDNKVFYQMTYGLFLLTAQDEGKDNGCIINTAIQVANNPTRVSIAVIKSNKTNEMIQKTSTTYAPWHILESVDKKYARIKALRIVIAELEKVLD